MTQKSAFNCNFTYIIVLFARVLAQFLMDVFTGNAIKQLVDALAVLHRVVVHFMGSLGGTQEASVAFGYHLEQLSEFPTCTV